MKTSHERHPIVAVIAIALLISLSPLALSIIDVSAQATYDVRITEFSFAPQNLTISVGDTVRWNNSDAVIHTLWFVHVTNGSTYLISDPISPSTTWAHTFNDDAELQYYSLAKLWMTGFITVQAGVHDVAVTSVNSSKPVICQGCLGNLTATVENQGDFAETFNVTVYADLAVIGEKTVFLPSGGSTDVVLTWNATGFNKGNYTIKVEAEIVSGETDTTDNTYIDGWVIVSILGDITGPDGWPDGKCDMRDVGRVARAFGSYPGNPRWDPICDVVYDGKIDMRDIGTVARHFGETDP